jgi:hypothetical protein
LFSLNFPCGLARQTSRCAGGPEFCERNVSDGNHDVVRERGNLKAVIDCQEQTGERMNEERSTMNGGSK